MKSRRAAKGLTKAGYGLTFIVLGSLYWLQVAAGSYHTIKILGPARLN